MTTHADLAVRYAPVLAQKVFHEWSAADQIAPVDFAGELVNVADNPKVLGGKPPDFRIPDPKVYYSVVETDTHYFLIYAVYHVFDWWKRVKPKDLYNLIRDSLDEHVHDMEGALLVVSKEPNELVDAVVTIAHDNFYLYTEPVRSDANDRLRPAHVESRRIANFSESIDGNVRLDGATDRVKLYIEGRGHGVRGSRNNWGGGDEVWYYRPAGEPGDPSAGKPNDHRVVDYELVDIFEAGGLWDARFNRRVFKQSDSGKWAFVYRQKLTEGGLLPGKANPPWSWNDRNDASTIGEIATDPARLIVRYGEGWGSVSPRYHSNKYLDIQ